MRRKSTNKLGGWILLRASEKRENSLSAENSDDRGQKNHTANIGVYKVDGCWVFMGNSLGDEGPDGGRAALMCTSCGCHRNFDRPKVDPSAVV
ncbi:unnamed protein product [Linum tenue]|uniref:ZF-HD dimerization-type domain-containing protein n=1 Tax=Linum tenue TaxID=586396 RepID=A0AAV0RJ57_9ROSI|nr:unnamed protein product [Linum tenue]